MNSIVTLPIHCGYNGSCSYIALCWNLSLHLFIAIIITLSINCSLITVSCVSWLLIDKS